MTQTSEASLEKLLRTIIAALCRKTANPQIRFSADEDTFIIRVDGRDQGRCIGKKGIVIWAINTIMFYAGLASGSRPVSIKLLEPDAPAGQKNNAPFKAEPKWNRKMVASLIEEILTSILPTHKPAWVISEIDSTDATITISMDKYLRPSMTESEHHIGEAIDKVIHAVGMANGVSLKTEILWQ